MLQSQIQLFNLLLQPLNSHFKLFTLPLSLLLLLGHNFDLRLGVREFLIILFKLILNLLKLPLASLKLCLSLIGVGLRLLNVFDQLVLAIDEFQLLLLLFVNRLLLKRRVLLLEAGDLLVEEFALFVPIPLQSVVFVPIGDHFGLVALAVVCEVAQRQLNRVVAHLHGTNVQDFTVEIALLRH